MLKLNCNVEKYLAYEALFRGELGKTGKSGTNRVPPSSLCRRCDHVDNGGTTFHLHEKEQWPLLQHNRFAYFVAVKKIQFEWFLLTIFEEK